MWWLVLCAEWGSGGAVQGNSAADAQRLRQDHLSRGAAAAERVSHSQQATHQNSRGIETLACSVVLPWICCDRAHV